MKTLRALALSSLEMNI